MAFRQWKIGLHIQQDGIFSVAIAAGRRGQTLRRWWHFPLPHGVIVQGRIKSPEQLLTVLRPRRHALPQRHCVRLAFPSGQTLQRKLPRPAISLRERGVVRLGFSFCFAGTGDGGKRSLFRLHRR